MKIIDISYHLAAADFSPLQLEKTVASPYTLVIPADCEAQEAVRIAEVNDVQVVFVIDPVKPKKISGILWVEGVKKQLLEHKGIAAPSLYEGLQIFARDPLERTRNFRHEWLNFNRPKVEWCAGGHLTVLPCAIHP